MQVHMFKRSHREPWGIPWVSLFIVPFILLRRGLSMNLGSLVGWPASLYESPSFNPLPPNIKITGFGPHQLRGEREGEREGERIVEGGDWEGSASGM